jgi:glycosyltransferase involved in cell wall biosynthesis
VARIGSAPVVGISLLTLVPGELGGSETYVRELLRSLARVGTHEYRVLAPPVAPDVGGGLPVEVVDRYRGPRLAAMARATLFAPRKADVVHYALTVPIPRVRGPRVITLQDVQHLDLPQMFSRAERAYRAVAYDRGVQHADRVLVTTEFVKERLVARLGVDPERIAVTPLGVDHRELAPGDGAREPFLLYPAKAWPHKNHARLLEAFALLHDERPDLKLVLTGGGEPGPLPDGVDALGHVRRADVVDLMRRASALVFPSLYEGFGLPPLEAMACGCPVACSNAAALPETVGGAARLFDPHDPVAIADAVRDVLDDPGPWVERGLARAAQFSWDETARLTDAVYGELRTRS